MLKLLGVRWDDSWEGVHHWRVKDIPQTPFLLQYVRQSSHRYGNLSIYVCYTINTNDMPWNLNIIDDIRRNLAFKDHQIIINLNFQPWKLTFYRRQDVRAARRQVSIVPIIAVPHSNLSSLCFECYAENFADKCQECACAINPNPGFGGKVWPWERTKVEAFIELRRSRHTRGTFNCA